VGSWAATTAYLRFKCARVVITSATMTNIAANLETSISHESTTMSFKVRLTFRLPRTPTREQALDAVKDIVAECWLQANEDYPEDGEWLCNFLNDGYERPLLDGN
jgi:hypothetical protein